MTGRQARRAADGGAEAEGSERLATRRAVKRNEGLTAGGQRVPAGGAAPKARVARVLSAEAALARQLAESEARYLLRLYVAGFTARSTTAISNLKAICEEHLKGRYQLDVVDIYQQPSLARQAQITAAPTLIRRLPKPLRQIVGDMSRKDRVLIGLDLLPQA